MRIGIVQVATQRVGQWIDLVRSGPARSLAWLLADRLGRLGIGIVVQGAIARGLGAEQFGQLNFVIAYVAMFLALSPLGMDGLIVRSLVSKGTQESNLVVGALVLRMVAGAIGATVALGCAVVFEGNASQLKMAIAILAVGQAFQAFEVGDLKFQAQGNIRVTVLPKWLVFFSLSAAKVYVAVNQPSVNNLMALSSLEYALGGLASWWVFKRHSKKCTSMPAAIGESLIILKRAWPLAISAAAVIVYMRVGQVMVMKLLGASALGVYSAAIRLPDIANFIPIVMASALLPMLVRAGSTGGTAYRSRLLWYFRVNAALSIGIALTCSVFSDWIIRVVFGKGFVESAPLLAVYSWSLVFVFLGVARSQHMLNIGLQHYLLAYTLLGMLVNIGMNWYLIPTLGSTGAALATVCSYAVSAFGTSFISPKTWEVGTMQLKALFTPWLALRPPSRVNVE